MKNAMKAISRKSVGICAIRFPTAMYRKRIQASASTAMSAWCGVISFSNSRRTHRLRSEEHTSELQSLTNLVCRLLLEKKYIRFLTKLCAAAVLFDADHSARAAHSEAQRCQAIDGLLVKPFVNIPHRRFRVRFHARSVKFG